METKQLSREEKVILSVTGHLDNCIDAGFFEGIKALTPEGRILFQQLEDEGFQPTDDEIYDTLVHMETDPTTVITKVCLNN